MWAIYAGITLDISQEVEFFGVLPSELLERLYSDSCCFSMFHIQPLFTHLNAAWESYVSILCEFLVH